MCKSTLSRCLSMGRQCVHAYGRLPSIYKLQYVGAKRILQSWFCQLFDEELLVYSRRDVVANEAANFVTLVTIDNAAWDWEGAGASVKDPVYYDATGTIQLDP